MKIRYFIYCLTSVICSCNISNDTELLNDTELVDTTLTSIDTTMVDINLDPATIELELKNRPDDTIFLDFKFGMTETQYEKHKNDLVQEKKLIVSAASFNQAVYRIKVDNDYYEADLMPTWYEDKLMNIDICFCNPFVNHESENVYKYFESKLNQKYGKSDAIFNQMEHTTKNFWQKDNLTISLEWTRFIWPATSDQMPEAVVLKYSDSKTTRLLNIKQFQKEKEEQEKRSDDL